MVVYFLGAGSYLLFLLVKFHGDRDCPKTDIFPWVILFFASSFWFIVIPISICELRAKLKAKAKSESYSKFNSGSQSLTIEGQVQQFELGNL